MKITVTRDSVAAGDDVLAPHEQSLSISNDWDFDELVQSAFEISALPRVIGGRATWALSANIPLAVAAQQWSKPKLIWGLPTRRDMLNHYGEVIRMHWTYFDQLDPDVVLEVLSRLVLTGS
jgi:hypothetical protein